MKKIANIIGGKNIKSSGVYKGFNGMWGIRRKICREYWILYEEVIREYDMKFNMCIYDYNLRIV